MKVKNSFEKRIYNSRFFKQATSRAEKISNNPDLLNDLIIKANDKAKQKGRGVLDESWEPMMAFFRMLKAYAGGDYRKIPWRTLVAIVAAVVYFVMPLDAIPDFILGLGFTDDMAVVLLTMNLFKTDIEEFQQWEMQRIANGTATDA